MRNELSGTASGPNVQAGSIKGGVHFHPPAHPAVVPRQLPAAAPHFVGRLPELAHLTDLLDGRYRQTNAVVISAIDGTAGVGKTALAVHWAHEVSSQFPDGQLYVDLRGFDPVVPPVDPGDVVRGFLTAFGLPSGPISVDLDTQAALYRSLLADRRVLIVLDNARDAHVHACRWRCP